MADGGPDGGSSVGGDGPRGPLISPLADAARVAGLCPSHPGEPRAIYCKTCVALICSECLVDEHEDHKVTSSRKQLPLLKEEIADTLPVLQAAATERQEKLAELTATVDLEEKAFCNELQDREEKETDLVAELDNHYRRLHEELEKDCTQKKEALRQRMTGDYKKMVQGELEKLTSAREELRTKCEELQDIISLCHSRLDMARATSELQKPNDPKNVSATDDLVSECNRLNMTDVMSVLPQLKRLHETLLPPDLPDFRPAPPLHVPPRMKRSYATVTLDEKASLLRLKKLTERIAEGTTGDVQAMLKTTFVKECKNLAAGAQEQQPEYSVPLKPDETCEEEDLTPVSLKVVQELAELLGGGDILIEEKRHKGQVLRTAEGHVTHVRVAVGNKSYNFCWLPAHVSVRQAVRLARGFNPSKVKDWDSSVNVTKTKTLDWFDTSSYCCLRIIK